MVSEALTGSHTRLGPPLVTHQPPMVLVIAAVCESQETKRGLVRSREAPVEHALDASPNRGVRRPEANAIHRLDVRHRKPPLGAWSQSSSDAIYASEHGTWAG